MKELQTEIEIAAPPAKVWSILTDFNNWKRWNPIVSQASGASAAGSKLSVTMRGPDGKNQMKYAPTVTHFQEPSSFRWNAVMMAGFLFSNDKIFELEETNSGTLLTHREEFSGLLLPLFWGRMNKEVVPMLKSMNDALKIEVEKASAL